jgi:cytochrome c551/c552
MAHKSGPKDVGPSARGSSTAFNTGGGPGRSFAQGKIPGPASPGQPISMKKALARKVLRGTATGAAGTLR